MFTEKFIGSMLVLSFTVGAISAEEEHGWSVHMPVQPVQSFAVISASGNNNTTVAPSYGWAIQTSIEAGMGYKQFLEPPYAGNQSVPASLFSKR